MFGLGSWGLVTDTENTGFWGSTKRQSLTTTASYSHTFWDQPLLLRCRSKHKTHPFKVSNGLVSDSVMFMFYLAWLYSQRLIYYIYCNIVQDSWNHRPIWIFTAFPFFFECLQSFRFLQVSVNVLLLFHSFPFLSNIQHVERKSKATHFHIKTIPAPYCVLLIFQSCSIMVLQSHRDCFLTFLTKSFPCAYFMVRKWQKVDRAEDSFSKWDGFPGGHPNPQANQCPWEIPLF